MTKRHLCLLLLLVVPAAWGGLPSPKVPDGFGVSIHRIEDPREFDWIAEAGFGIVRLDLVWEQVERKPGVYDWAHYDEMLAQLTSRRLRPLLILDYGNALHSPQVQVEGRAGPSKAAAPVLESERQAFMNYVRAAVVRYRRFDPIWEIWNEPEHNEFWPPRRNDEHYVQLAQRACQTIRNADPNATVVAPGAAKAPTDADPRPALLEALLASPAATCLSAISVHPYWFVPALDDSPKTWSRLHDMIERARPTGPRPEMVNTESGVSTFKYQVATDIQAAYLVRLMLLGAASKISVNVWYDWRDDGDDPSDPQHRFGVIRRDFSRKPAFEAMKVMTGLLKQMTFQCNVSASRSPITQLLFADPLSDAAVLVVWQPSHVPAWQRIDLSDVFSIQGSVDMLGQNAQISRVNTGSISMQLSQRPTFLKLNVPKGQAASALCPVARP